MPLHIDYRPKSFDEVVGNKPAVDSLRAIFNRKKDFPHAYLLQGPKGCGKTTLARIIAGLLGCVGNDFIEINSSNDRGIATARTIMDGAKFKPMMGKSRVYLLDEVHMTSHDFQNAMLKPLEDAPAHAYYILCTTESGKLIEALRSRCNIFEVQNLREREMIMLLQGVIKKEEATVSLEIMKKIADASDGCPRDGLKILDQIIDLPDDKRLSAIEGFEYYEKQTIDLYNSLVKQSDWKKLSGIISKMDLSNPETARRAILGLASFNLLRSGDKMAALIIDSFKDPLYNTGKAGFVLAAYKSMLELSSVEPF